tara:strand:+ start:331 stop:714 length:384 start_codon:yes stop_codon:yes gene_type:complete
MKYLIILLLFFLSSSVLTNEFKWEKIGTNIDGSNFYTDYSTIKKIDNKVYYLQLTDYHEPTENGDLSSIIYIEVNCSNLNFRYLKDFYHEFPMGKGEPRHIINEKSDWMVSRQGSVGIKIRKGICNY